MRAYFGILLVICVLLPVASASAQPQPQQQVVERDRLIADQENLLNTYRCLFGVDVDVVPGGCANPDTIAAGAAPANPVASDLVARDGLIQSQEALLNVYRCQYSIDAHLVPGGCSKNLPSPSPTPSSTPTAAPTPSVQTVSVVLCGSEGDFDDQVALIPSVDTSQDLLEAMVAQLNKVVSPFWSWHSSGFSRLNFIEAGVVERGDIERTTTLTLSELRAKCISFDRPPQTTILTYLPSYSGGGGIARGKTIFMTMDLEGGCIGCGRIPFTNHKTTIHEFGTELHELAHSVYSLRHTRIGIPLGQCLLLCGVPVNWNFADASRGAYTLLGFPYLTIDGVTPVVEHNMPNGDTISRPGWEFPLIESEQIVEVADLNIEGRKPAEGLGSVIDRVYASISLACYERERAGLPVGGDNPPCVRLPPDTVDFENVDSPPFHRRPYETGDGSDWTSQVVDGKFAVGWRPPTWTDGAPITGYVIRVSCLNESRPVGGGFRLEGELISEQVVSSSVRSAVLDFDAALLGDGRQCDKRKSKNLDPGVVVSVSALSKYGEGVIDRARVEVFAPEATVTRQRYRSLSAGVDHDCAVRLDGSIVCWGNTSYGGEGLIKAPAGTFKSVSAGSSHSCAVRTDDSIVCWGSTWASEKGLLDAPAGTFKSVSAGGYGSCAVRSDDSIVCWGSTWASEKGLLDAPAGTFKSVSAGGYGSCAVRSDDAIVCWGDTSEVGLLDAPAGTFKSVSVGSSHSCAVRSDDSIVCWGDTTWGERLIDAPAGTFKSVSVGGFGSCAVRSDDAIVCWHYGVVDFGPVAGVYKSVVRRSEGYCAVRSDDSAFCVAKDGKVTELNV
ncbi:MAG: hypothetical protein OXG34_01145 [bacterium]|nr:hypothetical protein [bacterium]